MPNADYWKKRFLQLEAEQNQKGKNCCKEIEQQYRTSIKSIDKKINEWYGRLAANNDVTVQDAYKLLDANELKEFKWDVNQYIKYGRENGVNGRWMKELENASAKYHISRLEAMKMDLRQELESLTARQQKTIDKTMRNVYKDGYMHTAYEIQKGMHIGWDFSTIDKRKIDKIINSPWAADGKNFSERIWGNGTKLVGELNQILTQNIILGESPQKAIDKLSKRMDVSKMAAGRLVMTEQAFFSAASQREAFKELDVEEFQIVATLDSHTSNICRKMDRKHFPMSEWEVGVNAPPFHVYCRSTIKPYFDDEEELGIVGERAARNEDGEVYYVPGNMTYNEWEQAFVKDDKSDVQQIGSMKQFAKDLKADLSGKEARAVRQVEKNLADISGIPLDNIDMAGLQHKTAEMIYSSYDTVLSKYPELKGNLKALKYDNEIIDDAYAECRVFTGEIHVKGQFADYDELAKSYSDDVRAKFHPVGTEHSSIIAHELGHALDGYMTKQNLLKIYDTQYDYSEYISETIKDMTLKMLGFDKQEIEIELKSQGLTASQRCDILEKKEQEFITNNVSEYAADDAQEFFAECFAEYIMSDKPRDAARIFGEIIDKLLGR